MASWDIDESKLGFIKPSEADDIAIDIANSYGFELPFPIPGWTMHSDTAPAVSLIKDKKKIIDYEKNFEKYKKIEDMLGDTLEYSTGKYKLDKPILDNLMGQRYKYLSSKDVFKEGYEQLESGGVGKRMSWDVFNNELLSEKMRTKLRRGSSGLKNLGLGALPIVGALLEPDMASAAAGEIIPGGVDEIGRGSDISNSPESEFDPRYTDYLKRLRRK
jgi:hypothetical protein